MVTTKRVTDLGTQLRAHGFVSYLTTIENQSNQDKSNIKLKINVPEIVNIKSISYIEKDSNGKEELKSVDYSEEMDIGTIKAGEKKDIKYALNIGGTTEDQKIYISAIATQNKMNYRSNEVSDNVKGISVEYGMEINKKGYLKIGDELTYTLTIRNKSDTDINSIEILDEIPFRLTIKSIYVNGEKETFYEYNEKGEMVKVEAPTRTMYITKSIKANSQLVVEINCEVTRDPGLKNEVTITNQAQITILQNALKTGEVTNIILPTAEAENQTDENTHIISGLAWEDENKNGKRENSEIILSDIKVELLNIDTNQIQTDANGVSISATTNEHGIYILNNVPNGKYIVIFNYDTSTYKPTTYQADGIDSGQNSDIVQKELTINDETKKYGITDIIDIENSNIANIDCGLVILEKFDLKLEKTISDVTVQNEKGTKTYTFNETNMAKIEIHSKLIEGSIVKIKYNIKITNAGEIPGVVKKIVDYLPEGLEIDNKSDNWYKKDTKIYNETLKDTIINAGETKTISLVVTKKMTNENIGIVSNSAEIAETYNENNIEDTNSVPNNQNKNEDDMSTAELIVSISTGEYIVITIIMVTIVLTIGAIIVFDIKHKKLRK